MSKICVVTTTIHVPTFLKAYSDDAERYGHDVNFIVIGDVKSPIRTRDFCETIPDCEYMDIADQNEYMARFPKLWGHLPFSSFERRDIGILKAYEDGADVMVTIDDDNFLATEDVFKWHQLAAGNGLREMPTYRSTTGWFNVCSFLKEENDVEFYHRGYSPRNRWKKGYESCTVKPGRIVANAGLWYNNPDTDAITRLERKLNVVDFGSDTHDCGTVALAPGTWSPFNCQNTAIAREVIPAYFMSPHIGRHSDIFASYVVARLAEHFGDVIAFGMPLANHERSTYPHDLWHDLEIEKAGMLCTDDFCDLLRSIPLTAKTYHEGFGELVKALETRNTIPALLPVIEGMRIWHETFKRII
jgi:hypothetical protein